MHNVDLAAIGYWLTFEYEQDGTPAKMLKLLARLRERQSMASASPFPSVTSRTVGQNRIA
jgi:hypothetical protein